MNPTKLVFFKSFLLSLTLLSNVSPALGMEEGMSKNGTSSNKSCTSKPTFGKLIDGKPLKDSKVWGALVAFKKHLAELEIIAGENISNLPPEIFWNILEYCLINPIAVLPETKVATTFEDIYTNFLVDLKSDKQIKTETSDVQIRTNIALELLADSDFAFLHSLLLKLIEESDLKFHAYPLAIKLGYSQKVQDMLKPSISKAILKAFTTQFSDNSTFSCKNLGRTIVYDDEIFIRELGESFMGTGLDGNNVNDLCSLLTPEDFNQLIHHMFDVNPIGFTFEKIRHVLMQYKTIVIHSRNHNIDLNFENKNDITPLMWTTLHYNGHTSGLQQTLILSGVDMDYKNKQGKSFEDLAQPKHFQDLSNFLRVAQESASENTLELMSSYFYGSNQKLYKYDNDSKKSEEKKERAEQ